MSDENVAVFVITVFVASIIPGPSMLLALTHGLKYGVRRTVASALGNVVASFVQGIISIIGLGAILLASENVFYGVKLCGAGYLVFIGIQILLSSNLNIPVQKKNKSSDIVPLRKMFFQSFMVAAGNPKAIIFFTAIFPQFVDPTKSYMSQFMFLTLIGSVIAFSCFMIYAFAGEKIVQLFSRTNISKYLMKGIGCTFIGSGVALAVNSK